MTLKSGKCFGNEKTLQDPEYTSPAVRIMIIDELYRKRIYFRDKKRKLHWKRMISRAQAMELFNYDYKKFNKKIKGYLK